MNKTVVGRPVIDRIGSSWNSLVVERRATDQEIRNWLRRDPHPKEKHAYYRVVCKKCDRVYILRSDVVRDAVKLCMCEGGMRKFDGIDSELGKEQK